MQMIMIIALAPVALTFAAFMLALAPPDAPPRRWSGLGQFWFK